MKQFVQRVCLMALAGFLVIVLAGTVLQRDDARSGLVVTYGGQPLMFELQGDDGNNYGFVITEDTQLVWEDRSAFTMWEDSRQPVDDWDVFSCSMQVDVVPGEPTESADEYVEPCVVGWWFAEKVTVTQVEADYFAVCAKPVIYLYPEEKTEVSVQLDYDGRLTCTYPAYEDGWQVTALPDGTLTDRQGQTYNYLYWEGIGDVEYDFSRGFCVSGKDTALFLEGALEQLGLTRREANEFIVYWLPLMEGNPYNLISFQQKAYTDDARLCIVPAPDTVLRVFMAWSPLAQAVEIQPQELFAPKRDGFTVVEWGGTMLESA